MNDPHRLDPPFSVPKWARVTTFVGLYALVLAGMVELEQSIQDLLAWLGLESGGLDRIGVLAGIYVAVAGLRPLFYRPADRNAGLYRMAWSLVVALSAFAAALAAMQLQAPAFAETFPGNLMPVLAACAALGIGAAATMIATRRRERMGVAVEVDIVTDGSEG